MKTNQSQNVNKYKNLSIHHEHGGRLRMTCGTWPQDTGSSGFGVDTLFISVNPTYALLDWDPVRLEVVMLIGFWNAVNVTGSPWSAVMLHWLYISKEHPHKSHHIEFNSTNFTCLWFSFFS